MKYLPLANILHHRLRSVLCALGIGIGVCMMVTLSGLARGSLFEVAERWESVDADLIVLPRGWGQNGATYSGIGLSDRFAETLLAEHGDLIERVVPVFLWPIRLGGQDQMVTGVDRRHWRTLTGGRQIARPGRIFDPDGRFDTWIRGELAARGRAAEPGDADPAAPAGKADETALDLGDPAHSGLEMVIDTRLAEAGGFRLNQTVEAANHRWKIVGIVPAGGMTRVYVPRRTAQYLFGVGMIDRSTLMFVKLRGGVDLGPAGRAISRAIGQDAVPLASYRHTLVDRYGVLFLYVDVISIVALLIAFLLVTITLYMMVLQQTREIAILKANGASNGFILRQVLGESFLMTAAGVAIGIGLSVLAWRLIETLQPLLTVVITWQWLAIAVVVAFVGAVVSALYPAWRATRVDIVSALSFE